MQKIYLKNQFLYPPFYNILSLAYRQGGYIKIAKSVLVFYYEDQYIEVRINGYETREKTRIC